MGILDGMKGNLATGLGIGIGASILAPAVVPLVGAVVRPLAKAVIKGGIIMYEKGKEMMAEVTEVTEDLAAEARAELGPEEAAAAKRESVPRRRKAGD
jgi:hypothetical protein